MIGIVGASFAGLSAYLTLKKRHPQMDIKLFDIRADFTFIPSLPRALGATERLADMQFSLVDVYGDDFIQEKIDHISETGVLTGASGRTRACDYVVIATGSRTNFDIHPSFKTHGYTVRYPEDIAPLNKALASATHTTIVGGGYTGIEVACSLATKKLGGKIRLVHRDSRFLQVYNKRVGDIACRYLQRRGVETLLNTTATEIDDSSILLSDGRRLPSDVTIVNTGIVINDGQHTPQISFHADTHVYQSLESDRIYTCGDVAVHGLYTTAHNAYEEGKRVGRMISDHIRGISRSYPPLKNYNKLGVSLGDYDGIFIVNSRGFYLPRVTGFLKKAVEKKILFEFTRKILLPV